MKTNDARNCSEGSIITATFHCYMYIKYYIAYTYTEYFKIIVSLYIAFDAYGVQILMTEIWRFRPRSNTLFPKIEASSSVTIIIYSCALAHVNIKQMQSVIHKYTYIYDHLRNICFSKTIMHFLKKYFNKLNYQEQTVSLHNISVSYLI